MQLISTFVYGKKLESIDALTDNHALYIHDTFDQEYLNNILKKGIPHCIINDSMSIAPYSDSIPYYGLPLYAERDTKIITDQLEFDNNLSTLYCFNFMINKKQINRFLCIKFVEYFKLINFNYTWSAVDQKFDMSKILTELDTLGSQSPLDTATRSAILAPIKLKKQFIEYPQTQEIPSGSSIVDYGGNAWTWKNGLNDLFSKSAISLITESVGYQRSTSFSEKTLYSVLGLTFPIWIGGLNHAAEWKRFGFDIFEDIIDHSYQSYDTLVERCYYAVFNNLHLLEDLQKTAELRIFNLDRLLKNRKLLLENQLGKFIDQEICGLPEDVKSVMPEVLKYLRSSTG